MDSSEFDIHPGEILAECLDDLDMSQTDLAKRLGVAPETIGEIVDGRAAVTAEMSLRLGRLYNQSDEFWLNLQTTCDLRRSRARANLIEMAPIVAHGQPSIEDLARRAAEWSAELNRRLE